jgi:light-regulated signal transduction histidine kinase (bacteriophytochrome)
MSEYIISGILLAAAVVYQLKKGSFEPFVRRLMIMSILITISAEMAFTLYVDVYGYFNMIGHYLKLLSFCLIYKAIIQMSLIKPYQVLFKDLKDREQILSHRTSQLETSNRELEAFSFSVSHDLRAPLRNIDGYSRVLLEDYSNEVDDQCKHYLTRIRVSTERMSHLIDDLLKFSRLSRAPLHKQMVKISALAHEIVKELHESEPERSVNFEIEEGITAFGDKRLLIVVITNLLSNAWKFTRKHATAHIEVGVNKTNGKTVYFVRDDGAGFDMKYVDKLFGPFQRLHKIDEFEGTGIGLATAQRIIHRHGGTIWAESVVEQGATFYFTLGTEDEKDE